MCDFHLNKSVMRDTLLARAKRVKEERREPIQAGALKRKVQ